MGQTVHLVKSIESILCVTDPATDVLAAVHRATWLARKTGATLNLFASTYNEHLSGERFYDAPSLESARNAVAEQGQRYLENLAQPLRDMGMSVVTDVAWDHPLYESIGRRALTGSADIVIKDMHHHATFDQTLLTNTDWNLIRTCPAPLWLVKPRDIHTPTVVLASIDPTNRNDKPASLDDSILAASRTVADCTGFQVHAFHAYDPRIALASATANAYIPVSLPNEEIEHDMRERHGRRFDELTSFHAVPKNHRYLISGATHEELPAIARKIAADVVVMGAIARNSLNRRFIGATAERTLEHLPCDLLIIKPDWFSTPVEATSATAESR